MEMAVSAKRCPECSKFSPMDAAACRACGHHFQTQFNASEPPPGFDRTQAFDAVLLPRLAPPPASRRPGLSPTVFFALIAAVSILAWIAWMVADTNAFTTPLALSHTSATANDAKSLYDTVNFSMSLYDLDKAADGAAPTERVILPSHLFLIYGFGAQSVRVMLYQRDPQSDDYKVVATSLWQGRSLLERKAVDEFF